MAFTFAEEFAAAIAISQKVDFTWIYHVFTVVEYTFICLYFSDIVEQRYRRWVLASIPLYAIISLSISYAYGFKGFPGMNLNTEGLFIAVIGSYCLMNLPEAHRYNKLTRHPDFCICFGWLIFFTGTVFTHGLYSYLYGLSREQALSLFAMFNKPLNLVLYSCLIIGFICAVPRKSTTLSS
jgi:hypothetical protein